MADSGTGPMVIIIGLTVGGGFFAWLCNFVFKPYIHRALSYCFKARVGGVLDVIDMQQSVLVNRLTGPPKKVIDPESGEFRYISPPYSIHKVQPIAAEEEKKEEEKKEEEENKIVLPKIETKRKNISPRKIKQMIKAKEESEKLEAAIKKAIYVPTTQERIAQGKYNFKRHFLYHKAPMGWLLTVEQYLGIDENARKNLYLQKHLGPYLHALNRKNYKKKNDLLPQWDTESVASMNSSKRVKKGYLYRAKSLVKYYTKMPVIPENYNDPNKSRSVIIDVVSDVVVKSDDSSVQASEDNV